MPRVSIKTKKQRHELSFGQSGARYRQDTIDALCEGFREAGIDFVIYLPDSSLDGVEEAIVTRGELEAYQCVREDEGFAMAIGAYMVGRKPVVMMEGAGVGLSALIITRSIIQRCPMMIVAGHCSTLGERYDYHAPAWMVTEPVLSALRVPYHVVMDPDEIRTVVVEGQRTIDGQKTPFGIVFPMHVIRERQT
jgi:sulfopyruvate decarboxylase TPP-binding subunit